MAKKKMKIIELFINEELEDETGIDLISFVQNPATDSLFMYFNSEKPAMFTKIDEEKKIVTGAVMLPDIKIVRQDKDKDGNLLEPHLVWFSEDTIQKCMERFSKESNQNKSNIEHTFGLNGINFFENWKVLDPKNDKSNALGFVDVPKGTWFTSAKINNDTFWQDIKDGKVSGFSVEGFFRQVEKLSSQNIKKEDKETDEIYQKVLELFKNYLK